MPCIVHACRHTHCDNITDFLHPLVTCLPDPVQPLPAQRPLYQRLNVSTCQPCATTLQVYYKLYLLSQRQLCLIRLFLHAMAGTDAERQLSKIQRMLPGLSNNIDMGLVQILAWYDRCAFKMGVASNAGDGGRTKGSSALSVRPGTNTAGSVGARAGARFADTVLAVGALPKKRTPAPFMPHCTAEAVGEDGSASAAVSTHIGSADPSSPHNQAGVAVAAHWQDAVDAVTGQAQEVEGATKKSDLLRGGTHPSLQNDADLQEFSEELSRLEADKEQERSARGFGSAYASPVCLCLCCTFR